MRSTFQEAHIDCFDDEQQDGMVAKTLVHEFHGISFGCVVIRECCEFRVGQGGLWGTTFTGAGLWRHQIGHTVTTAHCGIC